MAGAWLRLAQRQTHDAERWRRLEVGRRRGRTVAGDRARFLDEQCQGDADLRRS